MSKRRKSSSIKGFPLFLKQTLGKAKSPKRIESETKRFTKAFKKQFRRGSVHANKRELRNFHDLHSERLRIVYPRQMHSVFVDLIKKRNLFKPNSKITSLGSGTGATENYIAKEITPLGKMTCIDFAHKLNLQAKEIAQKNQIKNIKFIEADKEEIAIKRNTQDAILAINPYELTKKMVREMNRILKNNAHLIIFDVNTPKAIGEIKQALSHAGFALETHEIIPLKKHKANLAIFKKNK